MTPEKCPSCGTKLDPDMLHCPNCPMSFPEDDPNPGVNPIKETTLYRFLMPALFFAFFGALIWGVASGLFKLGDESAKAPGPTTRQLLGERDEKAERAANRRSASASSSDSDASSASGSDSSDSGRVSVTPADAAPEEKGTGEDTVIVSRAAEKPEAPVREWRLRGKVFDLLTLRPVASARIELVDSETNSRVQTRTDSTGRYRVVVRPLPGRGYAVSISKSGYAPNYLDPATGGVADMDAARRKELAADLASTLTATPALLSAPDANPLVTDFYLAPRR